MVSQEQRRDPAIKRKMTPEDYLNSQAYQEHEFIQLIDGEIVIGQGDGMPPTLAHQDMVGNVFFFLKLYTREHGGRAYVAPAEVSFGDFYYEPDAFYIAPNSQAIVEEKRVVGAPDLVVEVLSEGTAKYDRDIKYRRYEEHGVREYWIVDPVHAYIDVYVRVNEDASRFIWRGTFVPGETFTSDVLGGHIVELDAIFVS